MKTREEKFQDGKAIFETKNTVAVKNRSWVGQCRATYAFRYIVPVENNIANKPIEDKIGYYSFDRPCDEAIHDLEYYRYNDEVPKRTSLSIYQPFFFNTRRMIFSTGDLSPQETYDTITFVKTRLDDENQYMASLRIAQDQ